MYQGAPLRLPKPRSDQFPVLVCSCPLCIINRLCICMYIHIHTYVFMGSYLFIG